MSLRKYRARRASRRGQLAIDNDDEQLSTGDADGDEPKHADDTSNSAVAEDVPSEPATKEQEVWDTVREEHYQGMSAQATPRTQSLHVFVVVEQLPLSLHRAYALIRELDAQVHGTQPLVRVSAG